MITRKMFTLFLFLFFTVKAQKASAALLEALAYAPTSANIVEFADITLMKGYEGADDLTSEASLEAREDFMNILFQKHFVSLGDSATRWQQNAEYWEFDPTDIRWSLTSSELAAFVIAFRKDFDVTSLMQLFEERGFTKSSREGYLLYQHELDLSEEWLSGNLSILNTAILEDEKVLIMSSIPESLETILQAHQNNKNYTSVDGIQTIAEHLGEVAGLIVENNNCFSYSAPGILDITKSPEELQEEFNKQLELNLHPYQTLALGYRYEADKPLGTLVMHYNTISDAQNDLAARQKGADEGLSFATNLPYKENVFALESASANGNSLIFKLRPIDDKPQRLFSMVYARDLAFAGC